MLSRQIVGSPRNTVSTVLDTAIGGRSLRLRRCVEQQPLATAAEDESEHEADNSHAR